VYQTRFHGEAVDNEKLVDKERKLQESLVSVDSTLVVVLRWQHAGWFPLIFKFLCVTTVSYEVVRHSLV